MQLLQLRLHNEHETVMAGKRLGQQLSGGEIVFLDGVLGAGKTTFCRGVLQAFGHSGPVKSPTYTLVEPYSVRNQIIYHFDLYRLGDPEELEFLGIRDYFQSNSICLVEWPAKGNGFLPNADITVKVEPDGNFRKLTLIGESAVGDRIQANF